MENIIRAGSIQAQEAVLCAVADHPSLAPVRELARIDLSKNACSLQICFQAILLPDDVQLQSGESARKNTR